MKHIKLIFCGLLLLALLLFPQLVPNPYYIHLLVVIGIYTILLFGLDIVVGYTGEISLGHAGLFGIGAYAAGVMFTQVGAPFWLALPTAIVITAAFGALLAVPALRVTGPYLAMVTLAFGTIAQILINEMDFLTNGPQGLQVLKPVIFGQRATAVDFYYFTLLAVLLALLVVHRALNSYIGRAFEALRGSPVACDCMGVSVYRSKVLAFVMSAGFAGLAGGLYAFSEEYIAPSNFNFEMTILFLLAITLGGRKTRSGAVLGAAIVVLLPNLLSDIQLFRELTVLIAVLVTLGSLYAVLKTRTTLHQLAIPLLALAVFVVFALTLEEITEHRLTIFGLMILGVVYYLPDGIVGYLVRLAKRVRPDWLTTPALSAEHGSDAHVWSPPKQHDTGKPLVQAHGIVMQFGGLKALDTVTIDVMPGSVHGLIGPNGSGKSTMMNVLTGIYQPTAGNISYAGQPITGLSPAAIAQKGVARTFQNVQLFGEMSALENVMVGLSHTYTTNLIDVVLHTGRYRRQEHANRVRAASLLDFVGLGELHDEEARNLPYGKQRLLEIARALALSPSLLLLDEPAAGIPPADLPELTAMIHKIRQHGIAIILVEHHMDVVMEVCDHISVLDFGQKIAEGTPAQIRLNQQVIKAYLGSDSTATPALQEEATC